MTRTIARYLFIIIVFLSVQKSHSQIVFCPPGAEWHYLFFVDLSTSTANEKIKYVRDSVIGTDIVKVVTHKNFYQSFNVTSAKVTVLKQVGDTIFMRNIMTQHTWQILYNYAALPGQSWEIKAFDPANSNSPFTYTITVDSINYVTINNFSLRRLFVRYLQPSSQYSTHETIDERIGCGTFLFNYFNPNHGSDGDHIIAPLCYQDSIFGLKQFTSSPCNYIAYLGIAEIYRSSSIKISPNPTSDFLVINAENEMLSGESIVSINDLSGRILKQIKLAILNSEKVNITDLKSGIYILNITNNNTAVYTGKLVKLD